MLFLCIISDMSNIIEVKNLKKYFTVKSSSLFGKKKILRAVDDVSFTVGSNECVGLVGESGCGKSTLANLIMRLIPATDGQIIFDGTDITKMSAAKLKPLRSKMQIIFQDPYSSLNPRKTIGDIIAAPLRVHNPHINREELTAKVSELLTMVGLSDQYIYHYPHEFSGGQRQRVGIARAIALNPKLILCDEPVSALDVSVQAQVINLLQDLKKHLNLSFLFIAHDLSVVKHISDRIIVMYLGKIVEIADKHELFDNPMHPYTKALISAIPIPDPNIKRERIILSGDAAMPTGEQQGCLFANRCYKKQPVCTTTPPPCHCEGSRMCLCHFPNVEG